MIAGYILVTLFAFSSALPKLSTDHLRSQFLSDAELREVAEGLENGLSSERVELVNLQETRDLDSTTLSLHSENRQFSLKLTPSTRLIHKNALVRIVDGDKEKYEPFSPSLRSAFFHGFVDDQDKGSVALAKTNSGWTGLVETRENRYILHGVPESSKHLLVRMEPEDLFNGEHEDRVTPREEVFNMTGDESFTREEVFNMTGDESFTRGADPEFELEIGAYTDEELWTYVKNKYQGKDTKQKIQETILIILNTVHTFYQKPSMGNRITVLVSGMTIMQRNEAGLRKSQGGSTYLNNFCDWDGEKKNPMGANYDIGLIFTGYNIYNEQSGSDSVVGMAPVSRTCKFTTKRSCGISEGKGFNAGLIMAHEIGHNLGMLHDGSNGNGCANNKYVMGPQISPGITDFSSCSKQYLKDYMQELDDFGENCMRDNGNAIMEHSEGTLLPGQRVAKGEQCSLIYGEGYTEDPTMKDFCKAAGCRNPATGYYGSANEAPLPGTPCGTGKVCYDGECMKSKKALKIIKKYKTTKSGSSNKALSMNQLCSKYGQGYPTGVDYDWCQTNRYRIDLSNLCTNLLCFNGASLMSLNDPSPPGTACAAGKKCENFKCQ